MCWLCGSLLLLLALALNKRVLDFGFLYLRDDDVNVTVNPHMGTLGAARLAWMFTDWSYVRRYMPLGWLNFCATYSFAGLNPGPYHAVGLGLYVLNALLVFVSVLNVLRVFAPAREGGLRPWDVGASALAAAWWAFHPLRVETTAWVSGNLYGQAAALLLASLIAYLQSYGAQGTRRTVLLALASAGYAFSLLTYPIALGVPVLIVGLDWLYARAHPEASLRRLLTEKVIFLIPLAAVLSITVAARIAGAAVFGAVPGFGELPLMSRVAQSAYVAAYFVWKPWWPTHLSPLYDTLIDFRPTDPVFLLSMVAVAAVSVLAVLGRRRHPALLVAWLGYLAAAAPFFGLTEKPHMASDRYGYFLGAIMAALLAALLARLTTRGARLLAAAASLAVIALLALLTRRQLEIWRDDRVHHQYVAGLVKNTELLDLFTSRLLILEFMRGNEKFASDAVDAKLRANPNAEGYQKAQGIMAEKRKVSGYYGPATLLAIVQERLGLSFARSREFREADDHFVDALRLDDRFYQASYDRALVLLDLGRGNDALDSFLLSERWASPALTAPQTRLFLGRLERLAEAQGDTTLGDCARAALAR
jgi:tetratricopeptide (TPR) repeat protein